MTELFTWTGTRIVVKPTGRYGTRGELYEAWLGDDLIYTGWSPEPGTCRELQRRGVHGVVTFWRAGAAKWASRAVVADLGAHSVCETSKLGVRFTKYAPYTGVAA